MQTTPPLSKRLKETDFPVMSSLLPLLQKEGVLSMSQGQCYWGPPEVVHETIKKEIYEHSTHQYCSSIYGIPEFRKALLEKVEKENKLTNREITVTSGANQGFLNIVLALCDAGDEAIIFSPYYFNHLMALQMCNVKPKVVETHHETYLPNLKELIKAINKNTKMVILTNPCNPTGAVFPKEMVEKISQICLENNIWLVSDETYEYFVFDGASHFSPNGNHVINLFSFSKAYGMPGWRVGYIASPKHEELSKHLAKVQDTVPISCSVPSQKAAMSALLKAGREWCLKRVETLNRNRELVWNVIKENVKTAAKPKGAIYFFVPFPEKYKKHEIQVVKWLIEKYGIGVVPGSCFGVPGSFRISYGNLTEEKCKEACSRLAKGLKELSEGLIEFDD